MHNSSRGKCFSLTVSTGAILSCFALTTGGALFGQTTWINPGPFDWNTPGNWSLGQPTLALDAQINNGGTALILAPNAQTKNMVLGLNPTDSGTLEVQGGQAQIGGVLAVGLLGRGDMHISDGGKVTDVNGRIGREVGSFGSVSVNGPGSLWQNNGDLTMGVSGAGTLAIQNEAKVNVGNMLSVGKLGLLYLEGGTLAVDGYETIGSGGGSSGAIVQTGGVNLVDDFVRIGDLSTSTGGSYSLSGGFLQTPNLYLHRGDITISEEGRGFVDRLQVLADGPGAAINMNGGRLDMFQYVSTNNIDAFNFNAGTVGLGGDRTFSYTVVDQALQHVLPSSGSIGPGRTLDIEQAAYMERDFIVDGGALEARSLRFNDVATPLDPDVLVTVRNGGKLQAEDIILRRYYFGPIPSSDKMIVTGPGSTITTGTLVVGNDLYIGGPQTDDNRLSILDGARVEATAVAMAHGGTITIDGGTLRFYLFGDDANNPGGTINFLSGTIEYFGGRDIDGGDPAIAKFFGAVPTIPAGKGMGIDGNANFKTTLVLDGGTLTAGSILDARRLDLRRGSLNILEQNATVGAGGTFPSLDVKENMNVNVTLGITNQGLVTGDGQIGGAFYNAPGGELRAQPGRSLALTGAGNANDGRIMLLGGELDFAGDLSNNAGGLISGNGSLITGGLTNDGVMNFAGTANIVGDVINSAGGKITSSGGGPTIFYDDVTNNGEIRTSTGGFTVFFGGVDGAGRFTGSGTVSFEGNLSPGNSPAVVQFAGDVVLGDEARLQIELGGALPGQYDQVVVGGKLTLGGALELSLIDGFTPSAGQSFDILNWGGVAGAFRSIQLPSLEGLAWNLGQLSTGVLSIAPLYEADFDADGDVGGADLNRWQGAFGVNALADADNDGDSDGADFLGWQRQVGIPSVIAAAASIPEPATLLLQLSAALPLLSRKRIAVS